MGLVTIVLLGGTLWSTFGLPAKDASKPRFSDDSFTRLLGGGPWSTVGDSKKDPSNLQLKVLSLGKGTPKTEVLERLGLSDEAPGLSYGNLRSNTSEYSIGRTHTLTLSCERDAKRDIWVLRSAELRIKMSPVELWK